MTDSRTIKRYNAYYRGWCLAFGEHTVDYDPEKEINWLFGEDRIGLIFAPSLLKQAQREFLGQHDEIPEFGLSADALRMNTYIHRLKNESDRENAQRLKEFLLSSRDLHMFLTSHLFYERTRIVTFAKEKPIIIMYKEMQPLNLIVE
jgi:hypothetical protein